MDMLSKEIDIAPGAMKDPTTLLAQLRSVDNSIRVRLQDIAEKTDDPSLPAEDVRGARSLQKDLTNFPAYLRRSSRRTNNGYCNPTTWIC